MHFYLPRSRKNVGEVDVNDVLPPHLIFSLVLFPGDYTPANRLETIALITDT